MNNIACLLRNATAAVLFASAAVGADLLNPLPAAPTTPATPVPLKPPEGAITLPARAPVIARPAFDWKAGDRAVLLGDSVLARDAELGFLETRLVAQNPDREFQVRNFSWLTNHPFAGTRSTSGDEWLAAIKQELASSKPTVVGVAFGNDLAESGDAAVERYRTNLVRLLDALTEGPAEARPRLMLFSPVGRLKPAEGDAAATEADEFRKKLAETVESLATNRNAEFVNLYSWVQPSSDFLKRVSDGGKTTFPPLFDDQHRLTAYGYYRAVLAVERNLRWRSGNWRFGYMGDGAFREGGFGTKILEHRRTGQSISVKQIEDFLPIPNPEGFVDREATTRPQCYIQVRGLESGSYALRVDGQEVQRAPDYEWGRFQIISDGPSWTQADSLRKLIVEKNALLAKRWGPGGEARVAATTQASLTPFNDPALAELDRKIAAIRKPVARVYEVIRVGDAPKPEPLLQIPGGQSGTSPGAAPIQVAPAR
jgi:hypothetical protein